MYDLTHMSTNELLQLWEKAMFLVNFGTVEERRAINAEIRRRLQFAEDCGVAE